MKFITPFYGVRAGEVYPEQFAPGDDCPPELQAAAKIVGALPTGSTAAVSVNPELAPEPEPSAVSEVAAPPVETAAPSAKPAAKTGKKK